MKFEFLKANFKQGFLHFWKIMLSLSNNLPGLITPLLNIEWSSMLYQFKVKTCIFMNNPKKKKMIRADIRPILWWTVTFEKCLFYYNISSKAGDRCSRREYFMNLLVCSYMYIGIIVQLIITTLMLLSIYFLSCSRMWTCQGLHI